MAYELTKYGQKYLSDCTLKGLRPVVQKQGKRLDLRKISELDEATAQLFLAPDGKNPYFQPAKKATTSSTSPSSKK